MADTPIWSRFDEIASYYDTNFLLTRNPARRLVDLADAAPGRQVLEVGCGTGFATFLLAEAITPTGSLLATDIAEKMISVGRGNAERDGVENIEFKVMDGAQLDVKDSSFDLVLCCHALFGFPDIPKALAEWRRVLRPDGTVAFSTISSQFNFWVQPEVLRVITKYLEMSPPVAGPLDTPGKCSDMLESAGFVDIEVVEEDLGYSYRNIDEFWNEISSSLFRLSLDTLDAKTVETMKMDFADALSNEFDGGGMYRSNPTILSKARKG